ncbi:MAG: HAD hydrolase-like protein, partial [Gammaproteobacteria bacterium]|nr:HAD hydrolase-like protein [Gammaproteobacteria bacterium]
MHSTATKKLRKSVTTLLFDLYGTVVDMQSGLTEVARPFLADKGWKSDPHRFVTWWRRTHFENSMIDALCDRGHTRYREIGQRAVAFVMDRAGIAYTQEEVRWLVSQIERLKPFPDVIEALDRLMQSYRLAILSNGDRDMLQ